MFVRILLCRLGKHEPAEGQADWIGRVRVAVCKGCGREILKAADGAWKVNRQE